MMTGSLQKEFKQNGYIVCRNFFSQEEMNTLLEDIKAAQLRYGQDALTKGSMTFNSCIFFQSEKLQAFIAQPKIVELMTQLIGQDFWVRWDQAVAKGPGAATFPWHQDNSYSGLKDPHYQLWVALTDMTPEKGGLWLQPQSHQRSLPHQRVGSEQIYDGTLESPVSIEAQPGDVVVFSSFTLHSTTPNTTQDTRWAYVVEYVSIDHYDPYVEPPYFVVTKDGKPQPEFVMTYRGQRNPINRLKYYWSDWSPRQLIPGWLKDAKKAWLASTR